MLKLEILLKNSNLMLAVHRKSEVDANLLFEQILAAIVGEKLQLLQLTCDRHPRTKIAVLNQNVAAVSLTDG
ncbi:hypothetical protein H6F89_04595 [Cyanobacteria bacterium FACHB-63]|nr:hypothetical protein [Cyanobacteria bacterium FACHB-63]